MSGPNPTTIYIRRVKEVKVVDPLTERLLATAEEAGVPVVAVTESMPAGQTYAGWMLDQLDATAKALAAPAS